MSGHSSGAVADPRPPAVLLRVLLRRPIEMLLVQQDEVAQLLLQRGTPAYLRSDNGPEFVAKAVREWLPKVGVRTLYIEPGSPWENGYLESFNGKLRDELLAREVFDTLLEAKVLVARWRRHYNQVRPHSSLGYQPPAPEAVLPRQQSPASVPMYAVGPRL